MAKASHLVTTPVGRMVGGSLYKGKTTNDKGETLIYKNGANKGQPRTEYSIGVAFAKTPGTAHWANEIGVTKVNGVLSNHAWLRPVYDLGLAAFPAGEATRAAFSWKITDGDSQEPNRKMKKPCDNEGYPGHWVIWFTANQAPKVLSADGSSVISEVDAVKPGYYVQVCSRVTDNVGSETPGIYWGLDMVAFAGYGPEISFGISAADAGFGGTALPAGATAAPVGVASMPAPTPVPGAAALPAPVPTPAAAVVPVPTPPVPVPVAATAAPARVMTPAAIAAGYTYEAFKVGQPGSPWTDDLLVAQGHMFAPVAAPLTPAVGSVPTPSAPVPIAVVPNPAILQAPAAAPLPMAPQYRLGAAAPAGQTVESLLAQVTPGSPWTVPLLIQHMYLAQ
jgi:hypothetical protein